MKRLARILIGVVVLTLLTLLDHCLKLGVGFVLPLLFWLPFGVFAGASIEPALWIGLGLGALLLGFWDCCDMFGLNPASEWAHRLIEKDRDSASAQS